MWIHPFLNEIVELIPTDVTSLVDVGYGRGIIGALMRIYRNVSRIVGLNISQPYVDFYKKCKLYDELYVIDLRKILYLSVTKNSK